MNTLFPLESRTPEGFQYFPDFITDAEEKQLIEAIATVNLHTFKFQGYEAKRKVASFGQDWNFDSRTLTKGKDIPQQFKRLIKKVADYLELEYDDFAEVLLTEYPIDSVINWHRDAPPFNIIVGISLSSDCVFKFRPQDKLKQNRNSIISLTVARRSLYVMRGKARTDWQHSISPVKNTRYSITLRTLK